ncbi:DUF4199 domain-containing protein [Zunongwangia sp. F363]|uniref:DUF4199 domain-containing protein n=1 Tax=Autumnicola tepida TaxID=3075595 RepID=A0ABU3CAC3_9FLAO|nr:DUF4199 domain-containing protein [Zunongwangia sp. F363]MDT0643281.1 DUF4199 domain-containing protein [Zunongwangia sp. F363]
METENTSPGKVGLNYGIILGLIIVVIQVIMYVTGMALEGVQWPIYIYYVIFAALIFAAINAFKKSNNGYLSMSQALKTGVAAAVISGLIFLVYSILLVYVIEPGYSEQVIDATRDKLAETGNMTDEQIEMTLEWVEYGTNPFIGGAIWIGLSALMGLIYSLIGGAIMKNKNPYEA